MVMEQQTPLAQKVTITRIAGDANSCLVDVSELSLIGQASFSPSMAYCAVSADNCRNVEGQLRSGSRESGKGRVALIHNNECLWVLGIPRPIKAAVSNRGDVLICSREFGSERRGTIWFLNKMGAVIRKEDIRANTLDCAISSDGNYACFSSAGSDFEPHSFKIFVHFLPLATPAFKAGFPEIKIDSVSLTKEGLRISSGEYDYEYSLLGTLLNPFAIEKKKFTSFIKTGHSASAYYLLEKVLAHTGLGDLQEEARKFLLYGYRLIFDAETFEVAYRAKSARRIGEILFSLGDRMQTAVWFRNALALNSNIGLKARLSAIEKPLGQPKRKANRKICE